MNFNILLGFFFILVYIQESNIVEDCEYFCFVSDNKDYRNEVENNKANCDSYGIQKY